MYASMYVHRCNFYKSSIIEFIFLQEKIKNFHNLYLGLFENLY